MRFTNLRNLLTESSQRAFRQRKEGYIKKLEQQVKEYAEMEGNLKTLQSENYALKEYVLVLQSRLYESRCEVPPPPVNVSLGTGPAAVGMVAEASQVPVAGPNPLEVAAQAVAGLSRSEHLGGRDQFAVGRVDDDTKTTEEELTRHLQADGAPDGLPAAPM
jgi:hypothetical protein